MTQIRCQCGCPEHKVSNFFNRLFEGIGHRGSSFADVDGLVDDSRSDRQLMFEFKRSDEILTDGQKIALVNFSRRKGRESWLLRLRKDREGLHVTAWIYGRVVFEEDMDWIGVQELFASWWAGASQFVAPLPMPEGVTT